MAAASPVAVTDGDWAPVANAPFDGGGELVADDVHETAANSETATATARPTRLEIIAGASLMPGSRLFGSGCTVRGCPDWPWPTTPSPNSRGSWRRPSTGCGSPLCRAV